MVMSDWWNLMRFTSVNIMGTVQHLYVQENENISYENAYAHGLKSENPDTSIFILISTKTFTAVNSRLMANVDREVELFIPNFTPT